MARLPSPGGDNGTWGVILNDFLSVAHDTEGALKASTVGSAQLTTSNSPSTNQSLVYNGTELQWANMQPFIASGTTSQYLRGDKTWQSLTTTDITSGTFAAARLPGATEVAVGAVQLASTSEVTAGTNTTKAVTPAGVAAAVAQAETPIVFVDSLADIPPGTAVDTLVVVRAV